MCLGIRKTERNVDQGKEDQLLLASCLCEFTVKFHPISFGYFTEAEDRFCSPQIWPLTCSKVSSIERMFSDYNHLMFMIQKVFFPLCYT